MLDIVLAGAMGLVLAVVFDYINGFHDTANAVATSVSTRAMSPRASISITVRPVSRPTSSLRGSVAPTVALRMGERPMNSRTVAIVFAVYCAPQAPAPETVLYRTDYEHPVYRTATVRAQDARIAVAEADVRLARADKRSDWKVGVTYGRRDPMYGDMASVGVSIDLPMFAGKRQNPRIAASESLVQGGRFDREAIRRELVAQLDADLDVWGKTLSPEVLAAIDAIRWEMRDPAL